MCCYWGGAEACRVAERAGCADAAFFWHFGLLYEFHIGGAATLAPCYGCPSSYSPRDNACPGAAFAAVAARFCATVQCAGAFGAADAGVEPGGVAPFGVPAVARGVSADGFANGMQRDLFGVAHVSFGVSKPEQSFALG